MVSRRAAACRRLGGWAGRKAGKWVGGSAEQHRCGDISMQGRRDAGRSGQQVTDRRAGRWAGGGMALWFGLCGREGVFGVRTMVVNLQAVKLNFNVDHTKSHADLKVSA